MSESVALMVPISTQLLDDFGFSETFEAWLRRVTVRRMVALMYGEEWSSFDAEVARIEQGRVPSWDRRYHEADWDEDE